MTWRSSYHQQHPYSRWHRSLPAFATAMDVDMLEACSRCGEPLAVFEVKHSNASPMSTYQRMVLDELQKALAVPCYEVRYLLQPDPADPWGGEEVLCDMVQVTRLDPFDDEFDRAQVHHLNSLAGLITDLHAVHASRGCA